MKLNSGQASLMAELGKRIGSLSIATREVEKQFREQVKNITGSLMLHVRLEVFPDKTFILNAHKNMGTARMILAALGLQKGASQPGKGAPIATISYEKIRELATQKLGDMGFDTNINSLGYEKGLKAACKMFVGSAKSAGIAVSNEPTYKTKYGTISTLMKKQNEFISSGKSDGIEVVDTSTYETQYSTISTLREKKDDK